MRGGGKVVKNAAGFYLHHLLLGSLGRLGIFVELTFKVFPVPRAQRTLRVACAGLGDALAALDRVRRSTTDPDARGADARRAGGRADRRRGRRDRRARRRGGRGARPRSRDRRRAARDAGAGRRRRRGGPASRDFTWLDGAAGQGRGDAVAHPCARRGAGARRGGAPLRRRRGSGVGRLARRVGRPRRAARRARPVRRGADRRRAAPIRCSACGPTTRSSPACGRPSIRAAPSEADRLAARHRRRRRSDRPASTWRTRSRPACTAASACRRARPIASSARRWTRRAAASS